MSVPIVPVKEPSLYRRLSSFVSAEDIDSLPSLNSNPLPTLSLVQSWNPMRKLKARDGQKTFANAIWVSYIAWALFILINIANVAGIITLAQGGGS